MNADRMISVFLAGVLVGGTVVYLSPNNGLAVGMQTMGMGGEKRGAPSSANGDAGSADPGKEGGDATPNADLGIGNTGDASAAGGEGAAATEGGEGSAGGEAGGNAPAGTGPGAPGSQIAAGTGQGGPGGMGGQGGGQGGGMGGQGGGMGGQGGGMGGQGGGMGGETTLGSTGIAGGSMNGGGQMGQPGGSVGNIGASPAAGAPKGAARLMRHLQLAPALWKSQAETAAASSNPDIKALAGRIAEHAAAVPEVGERLPPNTEILPYLLESKMLLERMELAGMEVSTLKTQIDVVSSSKH